MLGFTPKEKSWSVRLIGGYLLNGMVRADLCKGCDASTSIVARNNGNPNLLLFGCNGNKCKHRLIRISFPSDSYENFADDNQIEFKLHQNGSENVRDDASLTTSIPQ
jgi:hypothetical protein